MQITVRTHYAKPYEERVRKTGRWFRLDQSVVSGVMADLQRARELKEELRKYTLKAIANRRGIHRRTVQKLDRRAKGLAKPRG
jgi:AraC-like DNA-binding protein